MTALAGEKERINKAAMKKNYDKKAVERTIEPDDRVLVMSEEQHQGLAGRWHGPYTVLKKVGPLT